MLPTTPPLYLFRARTSRHRHLFAGLFGCTRSRSLLFICHLLIYIHSCLFVSVSIRVFCVDGPCPCVSLLVRKPGVLSFSFPFYHLLFGSRPWWSRHISPRTRVVTRQRGLLRGIIRGLVSAVGLGEGVAWSIPMVRSNSESIYPAFDDVPGECAELECAIKLVDYREGTCPSEP